MPRYNNFFLAGVLFSAYSLIDNTSEAANCNPNFEAASFVKRWNKAIKKLSVGNWVLPKYAGAGPIVQTIDDTNLLLRATIEKGCIVSLKLRSRTSDGDGLAALVGWLTLIKVMSPGIDGDAKSKILSDLGIKPPTRNGGTSVYNEVSYSFQDHITTNLFSVTSKSSNFSKTEN